MQNSKLIYQLHVIVNHSLNECVETTVIPCRYRTKTQSLKLK